MGRFVASVPCIRYLEIMRDGTVTSQVLHVGMRVSVSFSEALRSQELAAGSACSRRASNTGIATSSNLVHVQISSPRSVPRKPVDSDSMLPNNTYCISKVCPARANVARRMSFTMSSHRFVGVLHSRSPGSRTRSTRTTRSSPHRSFLKHVQQLIMRAC